MFGDIEEEIRQMLAEDEANDGNLPNPDATITKQRQ